MNIFMITAASASFCSRELNQQRVASSPTPSSPLKWQLLLLPLLQQQCPSLSNQLCHLERLLPLLLLQSLPRCQLEAGNVAMSPLLALNKARQNVIWQRE
jgi:hypothetical protein